MEKLVFKKKNDVWEQKLTSLFEEKPQKDIDRFLNVVGLILYSRESFTDLSALYNELSLESFSKLINLLGGRTIKFPKKEELREAIELATVFYYRECLGVKDYKKIKDLVPFEVNSIAVGKKLMNLNSTVYDLLKKELNADFFAMEDKS